MKLFCIKKFKRFTQLRNKIFFWLCKELCCKQKKENILIGYNVFLWNIE